MYIKIRKYAYQNIIYSYFLSIFFINTISMSHSEWTDCKNIRFLILELGRTYGKKLLILRSLGGIAELRLGGVAKRVWKMFFFDYKYFACYLEDCLNPTMKRRIHSCCSWKDN